MALKDDKVFLARRRPEKSYGGFWELPGGKVEPGETHESALARELSEELGIDVQVGEFLSTGVDQKEVLKIVLHGYIIQMQSDPVESLDHDMLDWKTESELRSLEVPPADLPILRAIFQSNRDLSM